MKTAKELILQHSRNNGDYIPDYQYKALEIAIKEYAREACKEQRRLCSLDQDNGKPVLMTKEPKLK